MNRGPRPSWLQMIVVRLGPPVSDGPDANTQRWMWNDGDAGIRISKKTDLWEVFAWTPDRSVCLRSDARPSSSDLSIASNLCGLGTPRGHALAGPSAPQARPSLLEGWRW